MAMTREIELGVGIVIVVLVVASLLLGVDTGPGTIDSGGGQTQNRQAGGGANLPDKASLVVNDDGFAPSSIALAAGDVEISVQNTALRTHGFSLLDFGIDQIIPPGQTKTFEFTATSGTYTFADTIDTTKTGTLTVR